MSLRTRKAVYDGAVVQAEQFGAALAADVKDYIGDLHLRLHDAEADRDIYKAEFVKARAKLRRIEPKWALVRKLPAVKAALRKARNKRAAKHWPLTRRKK